MRKFHFGIIAVLILIAACKRKPALPEGILPRQQMQNILWDLTMAGEFLNGFVYARDTSVDKAPMSEAWYEKVYAMHHITRDKFLQSYNYYQEHPVLMREVLDSLGKRESPAASLQDYGQKILPDSVANQFLPPAQRRADSIRRLAQGPGAGRFLTPEQMRADSLRKRFPRAGRKTVDSLRRVRAFEKRERMKKGLPEP